MFFYKKHFDSKGNEIDIAYSYDKGQIKFIGTEEELPEETIIPELIIPSDFSNQDKAVTIKSDVFRVKSATSKIPNKMFTLHPSKVTIEKLVIESGITNIQKEAFTNLAVREVYWPNTCKSISAKTFYNCSIESIHGIEEIEELGVCAFRGAHKLKSFNMPSKCNTIPVECFKGCKSLIKIGNTQNVISIGSFAFAFSGIESFEWPKSCKTIPYYGFSNCNNLKSITGIENVTSVMDGAFSKCTSIEQFDWPEHVHCIGSNTFFRCYALEKLNISGEVTRIRSNAIYETKIQEIDISRTTSLLLMVSLYNDNFKVIKSTYQELLKI